MEYFLPTISTLSILVTLIVWIKNELNEKPKKLIYPFLLVFLTFISTYTYKQNLHLREARNEASQLILTWPKTKETRYLTQGEHMGIILASQVLLEKHKDKFPDSYSTAQHLIANRLEGFNAVKSFDERLDESNLLEDSALAMMQLVKSIAGKEYNEREE